jgi:hypothetical protein
MWLRGTRDTAGLCKDISHYAHGYFHVATLGYVVALSTREQGDSFHRTWETLR